MRANKPALPPRVTLASSLIDRTHAIERCEILPLVLLQIGTKVVLELAFRAERALLMREFGVRSSGPAEGLFIFRLPKGALFILTALPLLLPFLFIFALLVTRCFGGVVVGIGRMLGFRCGLDDVPAYQLVSNQKA